MDTTLVLVLALVAGAFILWQAWDYLPRPIQAAVAALGALAALMLTLGRKSKPKRSWPVKGAGEAYRDEAGRTRLRVKTEADATKARLDAATKGQLIELWNRRKTDKKDGE